jgi:hypothetical protein
LFSVLNLHEGVAEDEFSPLNLQNGQYEPPDAPRAKLRSGLVDKVRQVEDLGARLRVILSRVPAIAGATT